MIFYTLCKSLCRGLGYICLRYSHRKLKFCMHTHLKHITLYTIILNIVEYCHVTSVNIGDLYLEVL